MKDEYSNEKFPWLNAPDVDAILLDLLDTSNTDSFPRIGTLDDGDKARLNLLMSRDMEHRDSLFDMCLHFAIADRDALEYYTTRQLYSVLPLAKLTSDQRSSVYKASYGACEAYYSFWFKLRERLHSHDTILSIGADFGVHVTGRK